MASNKTKEGFRLAPWRTEGGASRDTHRIRRTIRSIEWMEEYREPRAESVDAPPVIPEPPCTGCEYYQRCKDYKLACKAFNQYVNEPMDFQIRKQELQWTAIKPELRIPTKKLYEKVFRIPLNEA